MRRFLAILALWSAALPSGWAASPSAEPTTAAADSTPLKIGSWNLAGLGDDNGRANGFDSTRNISQIAAVVDTFDVAAFQGINSASEFRNMLQFLNAQSSTAWKFMLTPQEKHYLAIAWKTGRVTLDWSGQYDQAAQLKPGPLFVRFRFRGRPFVLGTEEAAVTNGFGQPDAAVAAASGQAMAWCRSLNPSIPILLGAAFGAPSTHKALLSYAGYSTPVARGRNVVLPRAGATFVGYDVDNIWLSGNVRYSAGVLDYPKLIGMTNLEARDRVSTHAPVFVQVLLE